MGINRMINFGDPLLRNIVEQYVDHYHAERNHQGLGYRLIELRDDVCRIAGKISSRERLGGVLRFYYRNAASIRNDAYRQTDLRNRLWPSTSKTA